MHACSAVQCSAGHPDSNGDYSPVAPGGRGEGRGGLGGGEATFPEVAELTSPVRTNVMRKSTLMILGRIVWFPSVIESINTVWWRESLVSYWDDGEPQSQPNETDGEPQNEARRRRINDNKNEEDFAYG